MYFPIDPILDPSTPVLIIRENQKVSVIVNTSNVFKELRRNLTLITNAARNHFNVVNTSSSFAQHLSLSSGTNILGTEWKWTCYTDSGVLVKPSLSCMITLVKFFENYGKSRFPTLFETKEAPGSQAIATTLETLNALLQKEVSEVPTSPTSSLLGKRKASEIASSSTSSRELSSHILSKKQRISTVYATTTQKEKVASQLDPKSTISTTPITLLSNDPDNIVDSEDEDSPNPSPKIDPHREAAETLLALHQIMPNPIDSRKRALFPEKTTTTPTSSIKNPSQSKFLEHQEMSVKEPENTRKQDLKLIDFTRSLSPEHNKHIGTYWIIPFFSISNIRTFSSSQIFHLGYKTQVLFDTQASHNSLKSFFQKISECLVEALLPFNILKWQEPFVTPTCLTTLTREQGLLTILQGLNATYNYLTMNLPNFEGTSKKLMHEITEQLITDMQSVQKLINNPSLYENLLEKNVSEQTPITPFHLLERLVKIAKNRSSSPIPSIIAQSSSSEFQFFTYIFSINQEGGLVSSRKLAPFRLSYTMLYNKIEKKLTTNARNNLCKTLNHVKFILAMKPKNITFVNPETGGNQIITNEKQVFKIILEGLLENQLCFNKYARDLIHHYRKTSLANTLQDRITDLQKECGDLAEDKIESTILSSLMAKEPLDKNYHPLFEVSREIPTTSSLETSASLPSSTTITTPSASSPSISLSSKQPKYNVLPFFYLRKQTNSESICYHISYTTKYNTDDLVNLKSKIRALIAESLKLYMEIRDASSSSNSIFINWTHPSTTFSIGVSLKTAISLILRGLQLTIDYYSQNYFDTLVGAIEGNLLERIIALIPDIEQQPREHCLLPKYIVEDSLMENLVINKKTALLKKIPSKTKQKSTFRAIFSLYTFTVCGQGRKNPKGMCYKYCISYAPKHNSSLSNLYIKTRKIINTSAKNAFELLQLEQLSSNVIFKKDPNSPEETIESFERLRDILLEGLQETKLFFQKYAQTVFNTQHLLNPVGAIDKAIQKALSLYSLESPPRKITAPTNLKKLMGSNLCQYTNEPLSSQSSDNQEACKENTICSDSE